MSAGYRMQEHNQKNYERPLECSDCQKAISVHYTELGLNHKHTVGMCSDCPLLKKKLEGDSTTAAHNDSSGICCGNCSTTLEAVSMGSPLGCKTCYEVFADILVGDILKGYPNKAVHCGRRPKETHHISPSARLYTLNEALKETLSREEYEEAARIRDEINALMESPDVNTSKKS